MKRLPRKISVLGFELRIVAKSLGGPLGLWAPNEGTIYLERNQPRTSQLVILVHEFMHAVDDMLIANGFKKRRVEHKYVEGGALGLFYCLVACGLIKGVSKKTLDTFLGSVSA